MEVEIRIEHQRARPRQNALPCSRAKAKWAQDMSLEVKARAEHPRARPRLRILLCSSAKSKLNWARAVEVEPRVERPRARRRLMALPRKKGCEVVKGELSAVKHPSDRSDD